VDGVENDSEEVQINFNSDNTGEKVNAGESKQLTALRLLLEIAKLELQKAELNNNADNAITPSQNTAAKLDLSGVAELRCSEFFAIFDRT
jgi:hypothetical protein